MSTSPENHDDFVEAASVVSVMGCVTTSVLAFMPLSAMDGWSLKTKLVLGGLRVAIGLGTALLAKEFHINVLAAAGLVYGLAALVDLGLAMLARSNSAKDVDKSGSVKT